MSLCSKWYNFRIRVPRDKIITFKYSLTIWTSIFTLFFIHEVFSSFFLLKLSAKMKLHVNWVTFLRQNKALYKAGWRNLFLRATCQCYLIISPYFNEDGVEWRSRFSACWRISCKWALPLQAQSCVGSITSCKNCEACENLAIRRSQKGSMERRTFTFEQQSAQLDFSEQENEILIWYETIIIIVNQKLSDLFQGTYSQTFDKVMKSLWPASLLKLKACFSRQVVVVPPQPVAAKVTVLYVAVHLNLRSVIS